VSFPNADALATLANDALAACGAAPLGAGPLPARSPITGHVIGGVDASVDAATAVERATAAFHTWRTVPAPVRGELIRRLGEQLRLHKADLATLVQLEAGKIESEALGEVQEMIDI